MAALQPAAPDAAPAARSARGVIRPGRLDDAAAILALEAHFPTDRMTRRSVRRFLAVPSARVWVADLDGAVVGAVIGLLRQGSRALRIYSLAIAPEARGLQLAQRLVEALEADAHAAGRVDATLEVRADNLAARRLYEKLGYRERAPLPGFYEDGADGLKLGKPLG